MKHFFLIILSFIILNLITNAKASAGSSLKLEGTCQGKLKDGSPVAFRYYSNFNGCVNVSKGGVTFTKGLEGLLTGTRSFQDGKDIYSFPSHRITFADSTGNTSGKFRYKDDHGVFHTVTVTCEIRDYEYSEC